MAAATAMVAVLAMEALYLDLHYLSVLHLNVNSK